MKKILVKSLLGLVFFASLSLSAQDREKHNEPKFKKTKSYSKSYSLSNSDKISLSNQFGEMKLATWDKNEIKVDVSITGKSDNEARAQEILDRISILDSKDGSTVSFKTKFIDDNEKNRRNDKNGEHYNEGMEINYMVYLPSNNTLKAENQFGKMIVPDYKGEVDLESKFGSLTTGKLSNTREVSVEFGKADIGSISGGKLNIKFSNGTVNKVTGDVRSNLEFSKVKLNLDNDLKNLTINNSYSDIYLDVDKNFSASWDVQTSHGSFNNKTTFAIKDQSNDDDRSYGPRFNRSYKGTSGSGSAKLEINSSFGEITAGHDLQVDMSEKKKGNRSVSSSNRVI